MDEREPGQRRALLWGLSITNFLLVSALLLEARISLLERRQEVLHRDLELLSGPLAAGARVELLEAILEYLKAKELETENQR